jgi:hypothetical protein
MCLPLIHFKNISTSRTWNAKLLTNIWNIRNGIHNFWNCTATVQYSLYSHKTNFGPTDHRHPRSSPLPRVCSFRSASAIFKCILEVMFCKVVWRRLLFCLQHLRCVKMATSQFYLQSGKQRKLGWVGDVSHVSFGKKFPGEREMWDATLSWCKSQFSCRQISVRTLRTFSSSRRKTSQYYAELILSPARTNSLRAIRLMSKKIMRCSWLCSLPVSSFSMSVSSDFPLRGLLLFSGSQPYIQLSSSLIILYRKVASSQENLMHIRYSFVGSIAKTHHAIYTTPNKRM